MPRRLSIAPLLFVLGACAALPRPVTEPRGLACRQVLPDPTQIVSWTEPATDRDRAHLTSWCAGVGPVLYEPDPSPNSHAAARPIDRLAIVSWNTHMGGGDVDAVISRVRIGEFTGGRTFDHIVLLLQEVYRNGAGVPSPPPPFASVPGRIAVDLHEGHRRDIAALARAHGMGVLYVPAMRNGLVPDEPEDRGNAILSTLRLADAGVVELPFERQRRVAAVASITARGAAGQPWDLRLVSVHLDTAVALTRGGPFRARARQAEGLVAALSDRATIVAGDFNAWLGGREPAIEVLRRTFPLVSPLTAPTWSGPLGVRASLDHVFARGEFAISVQRLPGRFGSDHFPLLAVVEFE